MDSVKRQTLREVVQEHVLATLARHQGKKPAAAAELGITLKSLYNHLARMKQEWGEEALYERLFALGAPRPGKERLHGSGRTRDTDGTPCFRPGASARGYTFPGGG